jgi:hypothetical protein
MARDYFPPHSEDRIRKQRAKGYGMSHLNDAVAHPHLFPTPMASDGEKGGPNQRGGKGDLRLSSAAQMFPTPRSGKVTDEDEASWRARQERGDVATPPLSLAVRMVPTPTVGDSKSAARANYTEGAMHPGVTLTDYARQTLPTPKSRDWRHATGNEDRKDPDLNVVAKQAQTPGQLNADWVELLMGWPPGWTVLPPGTGPAIGKRSRGSRKAKPTAPLDSAP